MQQPEDWNARVKRAEQERQRKREQAKADNDGLVRIGGTRSELRLPDGVFARLGGVPTRAEATWECTECGERPTPRQYANGFVPTKCRCQLAQLEREREEHERLEQWKWQQERQRAQCAKCYTWLGGESFGLDEKTFENFEMSLQSDGFVAAVEFAQHPRGNLVMWSDASYGTGKTHLAVAIANYQLARGIPARFTTAQGLFDAFAARMDDHQGYSDLLAQTGKAQVLVIDDLDKLHLTKSGFKLSVMFEVLNQRYLRHLPTVFTTNVRVEVRYDDVAGLSDYVGKAAASRLCDKGNGGLAVIEMNGEDYRRRERM